MASTSVSRLVVPLRVIEELDAKKYSGNSALSERARSVLPWLQDRILRAEGRIREDTTIEVPIDPARRPPPADADREILDECEELRAFGEHGVTLITTDTALRLRAHAAGIPTVRLDPEKHGRSVTAE
jgi:predicted ribonuclease YlaK